MNSIFRTLFFGAAGAAFVAGIALGQSSAAQVETAEKVTADAALLNEVAIQCADTVIGHFDALAEGERTDVPSPLWDDVVAQCSTALSNGANYAEAPLIVATEIDS